MSMRQFLFLSYVAVAASQYNYQQFLHRGKASQRGQVSPGDRAASEQQQYNWHQYLPENERPNGQQYDWHKYVDAGNHSDRGQYDWRQNVHRNNDWHQYVDGNHSNMEQHDWHHYVHMRNGSSYNQFDWHQYANPGNTSELIVLPGNFSGDASDATTEDELNVWRERAQIQIHRYVPESYQNESLAAVDSEYQQNLDRINAPANATAAASTPAIAVAVVTEAPAVVATEAPAVLVPVAVTEPINASAIEAVSLSESPVMQASPMLLMFALLTGVAVFAVAVGSKRRHVGASSEPLLPTEHSVTLTD